MGLRVPSPWLNTGMSQEPAGVRHLGKETSDCKYYLVHPFMGKHPESQWTNKPEGQDRAFRLLLASSCCRQLEFA